MTVPLVDGGWRVAVLLGLLGRRVIAWFAPLRSANPNEASRIELTTNRRVCSTTSCAARYIPHSKMVVMLVLIY